MRRSAPPPGEPLPVTLNRRRIYILPTGHGVVFIIVLFAMLLGSINYNNNLGFLLVFLLGSMMFVSIIHTFRNLFGLEIQAVTAEPVFAGQDAEFQALLRTGGRRRVGVSLGFEKQARLLETLAPGNDSRVPVPAGTPGRGLYSPGRLVVATRFPMGLFRAWAKLDTGASCLVYPRPAQGAAAGLTGRADTGGGAADTQQSGVDDFRGLKQYQPGDAIRHISWKTLSRGQGAYTKEFGADAVHTLLLDYSALAGADPEEKLSRLAGMVLAADRMNAVYELKLPGAHLPAGQGERHKHACLKALALFDARD